MFVVTPYIPNQDGIIQPQVPNIGPCCDSDKRPCKIFTDHDRKRKTGPGFPLRVVRCRTHQKSFTLYPPGYVPYGRKLLELLGFNGNPILGVHGVERFRGTIFDAALDAAENRFWPYKDENSFNNKTIATQANHLARASILLGIQPGLTIEQRHDCGHTLWVSLTSLIQNAQHIESKIDFQSQGQAVKNVLEEIPPFYSSLFERFAAVGSDMGLWPHLYVWNPSWQQLRPSRFHTPRTRAPP